MKKAFLMFALVFSVLAFSTASQAQGWGNGHPGNGHPGNGHPGNGYGNGNAGYDRDYVQCDSNGYNYRECSSFRIRRIDRVRLVQQQSKSACIYGSSWGARPFSIWVSNGCRATFEVSGWRN